MSSGCSTPPIVDPGQSSRGHAQQIRQQNGLIQYCGVPGSQPLPSSGRDTDRTVKDENLSQSPESSHQGHVFQQGLIWITADLLEEAAGKKEPLISVRQAQQAAAQVGAGLDQSIAPTGSIDGQREGSSRSCRRVEGASDQLGKVAGKAGITVDKEKDVAPGLAPRLSCDPRRVGPCRQVTEYLLAISRVRSRLPPSTRISSRMS